MISALAEVLDSELHLEFQPMQPGDVPVTYADISKARALLRYEPQTEFYNGLEAFAHWLDIPAVRTTSVPAANARVGLN